MRNLDLLIPKEAPKGGSWAWAKITTGYDAEGDYFVNVRLDGEDADLEATPVFLCDPEEFYDTGSGPTPQRTGRSLVQLLDGQVFVYGESGGLPRAPADKIAAGKYDARSGRILWSHAGGPAMHVGDGGTGWWDFAPTEGGTTAWRTTFTGYFIGGPPVGTTFYDTDLDRLMVWDGSTWITFAPEPTDTGWVNIPLAAGYEAAEGGTPQYRVRNGVAYIRGSIQESATGTLSVNTTTGHTIGTLPAAARPIGADVVFLVPPQNPAIHQARMFVWTNGTVKIYLSNGTAATDTGTATSAYVSLSATYPI